MISRPSRMSIRQYMEAMLPCTPPHLLITVTFSTPTPDYNSEALAGRHRVELSSFWGRDNEIPNCDVGAGRVLSRGLLGAIRLRKLPIYQRTNAGCVDCCLYNVPDCNSGLALPYQSLCDPSCECAYIRAGRSDRRNASATTASRQIIQTDQYQ